MFPMMLKLEGLMKPAVKGRLTTKRQISPASAQTLVRQPADNKQAGLVFLVYLSMALGTTWLGLHVSLFLEQTSIQSLHLVASKV